MKTEMAIAFWQKDRGTRALLINLDLHRRIIVKWIFEVQDFRCGLDLLRQDRHHSRAVLSTAMNHRTLWNL
jgi:hypothetical protein